MLRQVLQKQHEGLRALNALLSKDVRDIQIMQKELKEKSHTVVPTVLNY